MQFEYNKKNTHTYGYKTNKSTYFNIYSLTMCISGSIYNFLLTCGNIKYTVEFYCKLK